MGLDMYLTRRAHFANYEHDPSGKALSAAILKAIDVKEPAHYLNGSINIELPAGYWRKANHIHAWFVENVQGGEDNCEEFQVANEQLAELRDLCKRILEHRDEAPTLLPRQQGFFFGGEEYDEHYFRNLEDTVEILDRALDPENAVTRYDSFYYQSSW